MAESALWDPALNLHTTAVPLALFKNLVILWVRGRETENTPEGPDTKIHIQLHLLPDHANAHNIQGGL